MSRTNPLHTLYVRLSLSLVLVFVLIGVAMVLLTRYSSERYYEEITQRLNAPIAHYVANEQALISNGQVNNSALQALAHRAMVINPTVEVYLLDSEGRILGHDLGARKNLNPRIDLEPVRRFLRGDAEMPLYGDDPRSQGTRKIFTVEAVTSGDRLEGYVYVVLGGEKYEQLAAQAGSSEVLRLSTLGIIACLAFGLLSALLIFARLSRRLRLLTAKANAFCAENQCLKSDTTVEHGDEIEHLDLAFDAMQRRIDEQLAEIRQADDSRRELVAHVSHDLRTPLATMQGYIETLMLKGDTLGNGDRRRHLATVDRHAQRLRRLVDDLFELARLDAGLVELQRDTLCVAELAADISQEFRLAAEHHGIDLVMTPGRGDTRTDADIRLLERVIANLLDNALRHTPAGGQVRVAVSGDRDQVSLAVSDSGSGIEHAHLSHLFERGFRGHASAVDGGGSSGLGLAIVKRILDLHGAAVSVESTPGKGSRFTVTLPASRHPATSEDSRSHGAAGLASAARIG